MQSICFDSSILQVMDLMLSGKELFPVPSIAKKVNAQLKKFVVVVFFSSQFTAICLFITILISCIGATSF